MDKKQNIKKQIKPTNSLKHENLFPMALPPLSLISLN
jgi:hypothetical protein